MDDLSQGLLLIVIAALAVIIIVLLILLIIRRKKMHFKQPIQEVKRPAIVPVPMETVNVKYDYSFLKHVGARDDQQDACTVVDGLNGNTKFDFAGILCDGMGGLADGAVSSNTAVNHMRANITHLGTDIGNDLLGLIKSCGKAVADMAEGKGQLGRTGTTLLVVVFCQGKMYWGSVGDSRIYILRDNRLVQVNTEHDYKLQLIESVSEGNISREEALNDEDGEKLISFIGMKDLKRIEISKRPFTIQKGDRLLMCSDGLYNTLSDDEIKSIMVQSKIKDTAKALVSATINRRKQYQDNVSIITAEYRGE